MMEKGRTFFAFRNALVTGIVTFLNFPIQFVNRYFMVHYLGVTYLGLTSLFTNILSVLSLADLGIGTSIVFLLYKPLANHDMRKLSGIMSFYRHIYQAIAGVIFILGMCLIPFLKYIVGSKINYSHIYSLFIIYLLGSVTSYLFSYNQTLLYADQRNHIVSWANLIVTYVMLTLQIVTVLLFKNPLLYAALFVFSNFITNIIVSIITNRIYKFNKYKKQKISYDEKTLLKQNVVGNMFLRISGVVVTGTDNIFLSMFAGVTVVGLYANYVTLTNVIQRIISQIIGAVTGSIGNFVTQRDTVSSEKLFFNLQFINFIFVSMASLGICYLSNDIITIWLGKKYIIGQFDIILIAFSFYIMNYRMIGWNFISVYGLAQYMKAFSINEMLVNVGFTLLFMTFLHLKLTGILLGTIVSTLLTVGWQDPYIIFHHAFKTSIKKYFQKYFYNLFILILEFIIFAILLRSFRNFRLSILQQLSILIPLIVVLSCLIPCLFYIRANEIKYMVRIFNRLLRR